MCAPPNPHPRLRLRLVKLGCISLDTGLLGNKALSVIKLLKPYKLKVGGWVGGGGADSGDGAFGQCAHACIAHSI